jgi:hypothetical protein
MNTFKIGKFGDGSNIWLSSNSLKQIDSSVFKSVLEQMSPFGGYPNAYVVFTGSTFKFMKRLISDMHDYE